MNQKSGPKTIISPGEALAKTGDEDNQSINIFIVQTVAGLFNSEIVLDQHYKGDKAINLLVNLSDGVPEKKKWHWIITSDPTVFAGKRKSVVKFACNQFVRVSTTKKVLYDLDTVISRYKNPKKTIFYQNLGNPVSNSLFFSGEYSSSDRYIVEDGIANYFEYFVYDRRAKVVHILKSLIFRMFGIKMCNVISFTGIVYESTKGQYVYFPENSNYPEKSIKIHRDRNSYQPKTGVVLVIGQEPSLRRDMIKKYCDKITRFIEFLNAGNQKIKIFYKPHWDTDLELAGQIGPFVENVHNKERIEKLVPALRPEFIFSLGSSALINIASEFSDLMVSGSIRIIYSDLIPVPSEVANLFERFRIEKFEDLQKIEKGGLLMNQK